MLLRSRTLLLLFSLSLLPATAAAKRVSRDELPQGTHWRVRASRGVIHVLKPTRYRHQDAGLVIYVHGFNTTVDRTWRDFALAEQFHRSGQNALFVAVAAPRNIPDGIKYTSLKSVLRAVTRHTGLELPQNGPVVALGHSGGHWTIAHWLHDPRLDRVILLDGLYGFTNAYRRWVDKDVAHRLVLVARSTREKCKRFIRSLKDVAVRHKVPLRRGRFSPPERRAKVVYLDSQYGHEAIVKSRKVIPVILGLSALRRL